MRLFSLTNSLIFGGILVLAYVGTACLRRRKPELNNAASVFISAPGTVGGINLVARCLDETTSPVQGEERIYFAFAGLAMVWVAVASAIEVYAKAKANQTHNPVAP